MKIVTVTFRANGPAQGTPFSHVHVEATAQVEKNETPGMALIALKEWVHRQLLTAQQNRKATEEAITLEEAIQRKREELFNLERSRATLKASDMAKIYGRPRRG